MTDAGAADPDAAGGGASGVAAMACAEIRVRHDFFADWFAGRLGEHALDTAMTAFAPAFRHVGPDGADSDRRQLEHALRARRGSKPAEFTIRVENLCVVVERDGVAVVTYVEVQPDGDPTTRVSSAVFEIDAAAPLGVAWRHVQETWRRPDDG